MFCIESIEEMFSCLDRSEHAQMAASPIEEKADELIQEERAMVKSS